MNSQDLVLLCAKAAIDKKAVHSIVFEVGKLGAFTDYFLITNGNNEKQVQAIADEMVKTAASQNIAKPTLEGYDQGRWILVDFGSVVAHIFHDYIREFYNLESLWAEAPRLPIPKEYYNENYVHDHRIL